jgi:hypothetical protein
MEAARRVAARVVRRRLAVAVLVLAAVGAPSAAADSLSGGELRRLAEQAAAGDEGALERLRQVDEVDGRAVDVRAALSGASGEQLRERLDALADAEPTHRARPAAARADAEAILAERRFRGTESPRPLRRLLEWIGDRLNPLTDRISAAADRAPGGERWFWLGVAAAVVVAVAVVSARTARRRVAALEAVATRGAVAGRERPEELEHAADDAERSGDWERALRLRFRAGLLRLDEARVLPFRESITTGEVARRLRSRDFEGLARAFDEVVYGRRAARADDASAAREGWRRVLAEARPA